MGSVLKDRRTAAMVCRDRIGAWPGRGSRRAGRAEAWGSDRAVGLQGDGGHALREWDRARLDVASVAGKLERVAGRDGLDGAADLAFLVLLGEHIARCSRPDCQGWLSWAVGRRPELAQVFGALGGEWAAVPPGYGAAVRRLAAALRSPESVSGAGPG